MDAVVVTEFLWALNGLHTFSTASATLKFGAQKASKHYWNNDN